MKKGILILGALLTVSVAFNAAASEMMRYEKNYYKSGKKEIPFEESNKKADKDWSAQKVGTEKKITNPKRQLFQKGTLRDR